MYLEEIRIILEKQLSPKIFKLDSEFYGLQYGNHKKNQIIKKVLLTLDLSLDAIHYAIKNKFNLILSHHGLINKSIKQFNSILINKLSLLSKYPISIFVLNSTFLAAQNGIIDTMIEALFLKIENMFTIKNKIDVKVPIGRICRPQLYSAGKKRFCVEDLIKRIKINLEIDFVSYVGDLKKEIKRICVIGTPRNKISYIEKAIKYGCDCYLSRNVNHFIANFARDAGVCLINISHYKSEIIGMKKLCNVLSLEFPYNEFYCFESRDPIKTYS